MDLWLFADNPRECGAGVAATLQKTSFAVSPKPQVLQLPLTQNFALLSDSTGKAKVINKFFTVFFAYNLNYTLMVSCDLQCRIILLFSVKQFVFQPDLKSILALSQKPEQDVQIW